MKLTRLFNRRWWLWPFALLYGLGVRLWLAMYRWRLLRTARFSIPLIGVGNLSLGGSGKTPMVAFLVEFLYDYLEVATLSRGYGRKTRGFRLVTAQDTAPDAGDEPLLLKRRFPEITVAVGENRLFAIPRMLSYNSDIQCIILDDVFQHLSIRPGLQLLLTEYESPFFDDALVPAGNLREPIGGAQRADAFVVTKCPPDLSEKQKEQFLLRLPNPDQKPVFFSTLAYDAPYHWLDPSISLAIHPGDAVLLVSGIAKPQYILRHLHSEDLRVFPLSFDDHHTFSKEDIGLIVKSFKEIEAANKFILTTEKDLMRLEMHAQFLAEADLPMFVLPVRHQFLFNDRDVFLSFIKKYLIEFRV